jgi:hypothetical protein
MNMRGEMMDVISSWWTDVYVWFSWISVWLLLILLWHFKTYNRLWFLLLTKTLGALFIAELLQTRMAEDWLLAKLENGFTLLPLYMDWLWTTPMTIVILSCLANADAHKIERGTRKQLVTLISLDLLMLSFGMMAERSDGILKALLFSISGCLLASVLYMIWTVLHRQAQHQARVTYRTFVILALFISVGWLYFPLIWLLGPLAVGAISTPATYDLLVFGNAFVKIGLFMIIVSRLVWDEWRRRY